MQQLRDYRVNWRFISLKMINESRTDDWYTPEYRAGHMMGLHGLRVADALRLAQPDAVGAFYSALGSMIHREQRRDGLLGDPVAALAEVVTSIGLPAELADAALDEGHDTYIRAETDLAFERTGKDVGTPIITFHPGADNEASFFGPVIASIPKGSDAVRLWDAIEIVATTSGMAELKRSNRAKIDFA